MDDVEAFFSAESLTRLVTRHPALRSVADGDGTPLAEDAARPADAAIGRRFGREGPS